MSATGANAPQLTFARLKAKGRRTITHTVVIDDDCQQGYVLAEAALDRAKAAGDPDAIAAAQKLLDEAAAELRDATLRLRLRALPDDEYATLRAEHPPQDEDNAQAAEITGNPKALARWHAATFSPALVAACLIEPALTVEQAAELKADWNAAEWNSLFFTAIQVNEAATEVPAGLHFL